MDKRRMCPNCRAFIDSSDRVCPYCEMRLSPKAIEKRTPSDLLGGLIPHAQFTTTVILLINIGLFAASMLGDQRINLSRFGDKDRGFILQGHQWWRLITAGFFHGGFMHIFFNSWALLSVGAEVEQVFGTGRFIVFYMVSTVCGFLASLYLTPAPSIGASAALFGLIGVMVALGTMTKSSVGAAIRSHYLTWAGYGFIMAVFMPNIDNWAHAGGFLGGFCSAYLLGTPRLYENWRDKLVNALAVVCVVAFVWAFFEMFRFYLAFRSGAS